MLSTYLYSLSLVIGVHCWKSLAIRFEKLPKSHHGLINCIMGTAWLTNYPPEVAAIVISYLATCDIGQLRLTCRVARDLVDQLWKPFQSMHMA
jgi:hypothetical protein